MSRTLDIGIDLDGVVYDFTTDAAQHVAHHLGIEPDTLAAPTHWHFYRDWGLDGPTFGDLIRRGIDTGTMFTTLPPVAGAADTLAALTADGHRIHVVTARGSGGQEGRAYQLTRRYLEQFQVAFHSLHISADKTVVPVDCFLDDRDTNYLDLEDAGHQPYLYDQPWNRQLTDVRRVTSWPDFHQTVTLLAG